MTTLKVQDLVKELVRKTVGVTARFYEKLTFGICDYYSDSKVIAEVIKANNELVERIIVKIQEYFFLNDKEYSGDLKEWVKHLISIISYYRETGYSKDEVQSFIIDAVNKWLVNPDENLICIEVTDLDVEMEPSDFDKLLNELKK